MSEVQLFENLSSLDIDDLKFPIQSKILIAGRMYYLLICINILYPCLVIINNI